MGLFSFGGNSPPNPEQLALFLDELRPLPWDSTRPAILAFIRCRIDPATGRLVLEGDDALPDESPVPVGGLRYAPGALDGITLSHTEPEEDPATPDAIVSALTSLIRKPDARHARNLYAILTEHATLPIIDPVLKKLVDEQPFAPELARVVALWLLENCPDRDPVKFAAALLGVCGGDEDQEILHTVGLHEEFSLYAIVALSNLASEPDLAIWRLAQRVAEWGRIHAVRYLADTTNPDIRRWLLTDGCRNDIMPEYSAYTCAVTGGLADALSDPAAAGGDAPLMEGASEIIRALLNGGPAEGMDEYEDGARAVDAYLDRAEEAPPALHLIETAAALESFLSSSSQDWSSGHLATWTRQTRDSMLQRARELLARPAWRDLVVRSLDDETDENRFNRAASLAPLFQIDPWEKRFDRLKAGGNQWFWLMESDDPERIDRVLVEAAATLPLDQMTVLPQESILPSGPDAARHFTLDWIVTALRRFPGKGWPFVKTALRSPFSRNRWMAVAALKEWPRETWPPDARQAIIDACHAEVEDETREALEELARGE